MNGIIRSLSYIFHPLFMPISAVLFYFYISPRFFNTEFMYSKIFATVIMTVIIPILTFYMLKNLQLVTSIHLKDVKQRKWPLALSSGFTYLLIKMIFDGYDIPEVYFFFVGILGATAAAFLLAILKFKASLHMMGISGVILFIIGLSIHFGTNLLIWIAISILACGATATSRLDAKAHTVPELIIGFLIGSVPQLLVFTYWL